MIGVGDRRYKIINRISWAAILIGLFLFSGMFWGASLDKVLHPWVFVGMNWVLGLLCLFLGLGGLVSTKAPTSKRLFPVLLVVSVPLTYVACPWLIGFFTLNQDWLLLLAPIMLFAPIIAAIGVASHMQMSNLFSRIAAGVTTCVALFAVFFVVPAGAKSWTLGFATNFRLTKHPVRIQEWATGVLDRYDAGQLATTTNSPYWAFGREKLNDSDVPEHIRSLWFSKPSVGIRGMASDDLNTDLSPSNSVDRSSATIASLKRSECVVFSWYLTGILVGRPEFTTTWNPWYICEIQPGIYAYSGMK